MSKPFVFQAKAHDSAKRSWRKKNHDGDTSDDNNDGDDDNSDDNNDGDDDNENDNNCFAQTYVQ